MIVEQGAMLGVVSEEEDHEWDSVLDSRTRSGRGCPCCSGRKVSVTNSLTSVHPEVATQWHPTKNGSVIPDQVPAGSHTKYWWLCPEGPDHEWQVTVGGRTSSGSGCPCCAGLKVSVTNSISSLLPNVAAQWHPTKNGSLTPDQVVAQSAKKYWGNAPKVRITSG